MARELRHGANVRHLLGVNVEGEVLGDLPDEDPGIIRARGDDIVVEGVPASEPELAYPYCQGGKLIEVSTYQSVSRTVAVCPLNCGIRSGSFPLSSSGMTANEPPPPDSQLTERYLGLTYSKRTSVSVSAISLRLSRSLCRESERKVSCGWTRGKQI